MKWGDDMLKNRISPWQYEYYYNIAIGIKSLFELFRGDERQINKQFQIIKKMNCYEIVCCGKKWDDNDDVFPILSDTPRNAITKCKILYGDDVLNRCYMVMENGENVRELFSYGMYVEKQKRLYGTKYYYWKQRKMFHVKH